MYKNNPLKLRPSKLESFVPLIPAKQTTEVFVSNGKLKLQVKRQDYLAEELISSSLDTLKSKPKQPRREFILT
jgi:hypothetical protein